MKTFQSAVQALRSLFRHPRAPAADLPRASRCAVLLTCLGFLCEERDGSLVCCVPGAPIVRLPL
ncbi:hypothetical protein [Pseudomonas protegens]|uniref:hypothetical protein n=1 Tax=Pseudomonas protegens TaxID=380021 RepID=UPI000641D61A|nr:hypothetical protein [Pseudomonas protegens]